MFIPLIHLLYSANTLDSKVSEEIQEALALGVQKNTYNSAYHRTKRALNKQSNAARAKTENSLVRDQLAAAQETVKNLKAKVKASKTKTRRSEPAGSHSSGRVKSSARKARVTADPYPRLGNHYSFRAH